MRRLLLLRHLKTEQDSPSGRDHDRVLTETGRSDAPMIGAALAGLGLVPDLALVSSAKRTIETWELLSPHFMPHPVIRIEPELYCASAGMLLQAVHGATGSNASRLMIVGHNPGLHEFANMLVAHGNADDLQALHNDMPTGAVTVIDFAIDDRNDVSLGMTVATEPAEVHLVDRPRTPQRIGRAT